MKVKTTQLNQVRICNSIKSHTIVRDQPADNGGEDQVMTPPETKIDLKIPEAVAVNQ